MGKMKEMMIDVYEMLEDGYDCQFVADHFGLPLDDVQAVEKQLERNSGYDAAYDFAELYEGNRRFQMMVDSLMNPPKFTGVENG